MMKDICWLWPLPSRRKNIHCQKLRSSRNCRTCWALAMELMIFALAKSKGLVWLGGQLSDQIWNDNLLWITLWWTNILPWKITIFNGKIHYFYGHFPLLFVCLPEGKPISGCFPCKVHLWWWHLVATALRFAQISLLRWAFNKFLV